MKNEDELSEEDLDLISQIYFYLQDITLDMEHALDHLKECSNEYSKFKKETEDKYKDRKELELELMIDYSLRREFYLRAAKITLHFNTIVLCICRASESIQSGSRVLRKLSQETQEDLMFFVKKNYTPEIISYRNGYLAHPSDKKGKYKTREELGSLLCKMVNFTENISHLENNYFYEYFKKIIKHDDNSTCTNNSKDSVPGFNLLVFNLAEKIKKITGSYPTRT